jgi:hypothetical protein
MSEPPSIYAQLARPSVLLALQPKAERGVLTLLHITQHSKVDNLWYLKDYRF